MSLKETLEKNPTAVAAASVVVLILAVLFILKGLQPGNRLRDAKWMYDLNTSELSVASRSVPSPSDGGNGTFSYPKMTEAGSLVEAVVFTCADESDVQAGMTAEDLKGVQAHIGYLSRLPDKAAAVLARGEELPMEVEVPTLVSAPDGQEWLPSESNAASKIFDRVGAFCDGSLPRAVRP